MSDANLQAEWFAIVAATLADCGVSDVVVSPGSRSTPLVVAAVREPRLTRHTIIDERAAAFFALGQARITGRPSALVCTSGTALAHYLPAMIEANATGTPLLLVTADRPPELYDCRAPQTIDQVKLFGDGARAFFDLVPDGADASMRAARRVIAQAVFTTTWPRAGAVHVNARARKPLEPVAAKTDSERELARRAAAVRAAPVTLARRPTVTPAREAVAEVAELVRTARRGLILAGPALPRAKEAREAVFALARATGFAIAPDATSQLRYGAVPPDVTRLDGFELLLRAKSFAAPNGLDLLPDLVIELGDPPTSGPWGALAPKVPRVVLTDGAWADPHSSARALLVGDIDASADALARSIASPAREAVDYTSRLRGAEAIAWAAAEEELARAPKLREAPVVRALVDALPEGAALVVGNSLAVRLVDIYARALERDVSVLSQRGASGIDGLIAGAAGASDSLRGPVALLIGDVSTLHDLSSLGLAARATSPLLVLLLNNGGGRIFEQLPLAAAEVEPEILAHALTEHHTPFEHAAALYGVRYERADDLDGASRAIRDALARAGATLLDVHVEPSGAIALGRAVAAAVEAALTKAGA